MLNLMQMMEWREICKGSWQEFPNLKNCRILFSNGEFIPFQHGFGNTLKSSMFLHRFARKKSNDLKFAVDFFFRKPSLSKWHFFLLWQKIFAEIKKIAKNLMKIIKIYQELLFWQIFCMQELQFHLKASSGLP